MVKYCCVFGCGRNTKTSKNLSYHQLPKEKHRKEEWLKLCGRGDILSREGKIIERSYVVCSRHFTPKDYSCKMTNLKPNCKPSLHLPSLDVKAGAYSAGEETLDHEDVLCNSCKKAISGIRFKCVSCKDYDLCRACEVKDQHVEHFMLRMPENLELASLDKLLDKWREVIRTGDVKAADGSDSSDDDVPITRYKSYDSGVDLSEDVKDTIRKEVNRVLNLKPEELKKKSKRNINTKKRKEEIKRATETEHTKVIQPEISPPKRFKIELDKEQNSNITSSNTASATTTTEVVFADVNDIDLKSERTEYLNMVPATSFQGVIQTVTLVPQTALLQAGPAQDVNQPPAVPATLSTLRYPEVPVLTDQRPVMHVKLSDDLTELMVEVTSNNQKTFYKI